MPQAENLTKKDLELLKNTIFAMEFLHDSVAIFNSEGKLIFANHAYSHILGISLNRVLGKNLKEIEPEAKALDAFNLKAPIIGEFTFVKTVGKLVTGDAIPIFNDDELIGVISIFRDASDVIKLNKKINDFSSADKRKKQFYRSDLPVTFSSLKGNNEKFLSILSFAAQVAKTDMTILIQGESGTGKDLLATAIHKESLRKNRPFIPINCAAISESLWESELFGYEPGAFTGAKLTGKRGKFEIAQGGTLFLDEIAEIPLSMQAKLLRVLQNGEIEKVGGIKTIKIDTRIIAATNKNLKLLVDQGSFRADLFFRLHVIPITLPPLRERREDISFLAKGFLNEHNNSLGKHFSFSEEALFFLENYHWPGSVRELENIIQYAIMHAKEEKINSEDFPEYLWSLSTFKGKKEKETLQNIILEAEKSAFMSALKESNNNRSKAMKILGISRKTFYNKLRKFDLK
ncbi:MAG: sigma 54-interacting transcriptional regulator [Firmicutes bacterium]|nr:sigma 54-interacting transcriptional regulator [Bacillota bacterium]